MNLIKAYREKMGLKQVALAAELQKICPGIDGSLLSKMENGLCEPPAAVREYLEKGLANCFAETFERDGVFIPSAAKKLLERSFLAERIFTLLSNATMDRPISKRELINRTGASDREIRDCVSQLRMAGLRIGSSSGGKGYWFCRTADEYRILRNEYLSRIRTYSQILSAMDEVMIGQLEWEYGQV